MLNQTFLLVSFDLKSKKASLISAYGEAKPKIKISSKPYHFDSFYQYRWPGRICFRILDTSEECDIKVKQAIMVGS